MKWQRYLALKLKYFTRLIIHINNNIYTRTTTCLCKGHQPRHWHSECGSKTTCIETGKILKWETKLKTKATKKKGTKKKERKGGNVRGKAGRRAKKKTNFKMYNIFYKKQLK